MLVSSVCENACSQMAADPEPTDLAHISVLMRDRTPAPWTLQDSRGAVPQSQETGSPAPTHIRPISRIAPPPGQKSLKMLKKSEQLSPRPFASVDVEMLPAANEVWQPDDDITRALPIKLMASHADSSLATVSGGTPGKNSCRTEQMLMMLCSAVGGH